jgi:hypothetical protein
MDSINEYSHDTGQALDKTKDQLITQLQTTMYCQRVAISAQEIHITETSTRTPDNSNKFLTMFTHGAGFEQSADSTHPGTHFLVQFIFPATMNVKQELKK